jgi:hypothetical protein
LFCPITLNSAQLVTNVSHPISLNYLYSSFTKVDICSLRIVLLLVPTIFYFLRLKQYWSTLRRLWSLINYSYRTTYYFCVDVHIPSLGLNSYLYIFRIKGNLVLIISKHICDGTWLWILYQLENWPELHKMVPKNLQFRFLSFSSFLIPQNILVFIFWMSWLHIFF